MKAFFKILLAAGLLLAATPIRATQFIPLGIEEMSAKAQLVVQGTVLSKSCQRDSEGRIYTRVNLQVAEVWKGSLSTNQLTVVQGGGILGEEKVTVTGQVEYNLGEEVVAFLVLNAAGNPLTLGLAQGKFEVLTDTASGQKYARNLFHGGTGKPASTDSNRVLQQTPSPTAPLKITDLKQRVQAVSQ